ncbi:hypothetical protein M107_1096 [Bacteroides fragilis str. 3725 D9(v)]|nr:hypothetical protein M107_1096 [Bacteroides fragilis str. 3725 D9(v)]
MTLAAICKAISLGLETLKAIILFIVYISANQQTKYYSIQK